MKTVCQAACFAALFVGGCLSISVCRAESLEGGDLFFDEKVEPILRTRCFGCHSHQAGLMEGDLALDWRSGWAMGGSRGPAVVPGDPDASLLIQAVRHVHAELAMPDEKLPDAEIEVLVTWVATGAADPRTVVPAGTGSISTDWWSLRELVLPKLPTESAESKAHRKPHPVDAFIRAELTAHDLAFAPEADRRTLIRRLTFDLHGMPPSPGEVEAFLKDNSDRAYENVLERLLASPRYGERWARHWLDTIHFADSHGFEHDVFRPNAWRFRDYVIESFNADVPWERFVREQLAADVFFSESTDRRVALGYLGAGPYDHSAASTAPRNYENLDRDDLVTQTLGAFASTTANCARCHAHKFDPVSQRDYYSLQAVFAGIGKGDVLFDADPQVARDRVRWESLATAAAAQDEAVLLSETSCELVADWEERGGARATWQPFDLQVVASGHGAELTVQTDGSVLSSGQRPEVDSTTVVVGTSLRRVTAIRLDVLPDESLPMQGPGRTDNGNFHLSEVSLRRLTPGHPQGEPVVLRQATADFNQEGWTIEHAIDGNHKTAWGIHPAVGQPHHAVFELAEPVEMAPDKRLLIQLEQAHGGAHVIGRFRLSATSAEPHAAAALPSAALKVLSKTQGDRSRDEQVALHAAVLDHIARRELAKLPSQEKVYAAAKVAENERGVIRYPEPRVIQVLKRGNIDVPGEMVGPGALSCLTHLEKYFELPEGHGEEARRAALASWLTDPANPLTWRSVVNRVWHFHFGRGLCDTPGDFGRMGSLPSHPDLLDYLACVFRDNGGSLKDLHRLICTSQTYRQSSQAPGDVAAHDPENRLYARASRRRLDADCLRDAILAASGQLDLTMGGPGDQHFSQSPGPQLTPVLDYATVDWEQPGMQRRSIYRVVWRGIPDPFFDAFDFPDLGLLVSQRGESVSALQTLALQNNAFVLHHAEAMAADIVSQAQAASLTQQVEEAVRRAWLREPRERESEQLVALAERHGLAAVCRVLFNSNEFLFLD